MQHFYRQAMFLSSFVWAFVIVHGGASALTNCGAQGAIAIVENAALDALRTQEKGLGAQAGDYAAAQKQLLSEDYEVNLSEMYELSSTEAMRKCQGTLTLKRPDGQPASHEITYDVIDTEDGKLLVKEDIKDSVLGLPIASILMAENALVTSMQNALEQERERDQKIKDTKLSDRNNYLKFIFSKIKTLFDSNNFGSERGAVIILFNVSDDGQISDVKVQRSSGIRHIDTVGVRSIEKASPLPPLPPASPHGLRKVLAPTFPDWRTPSSGSISQPGSASDPPSAGRY